MRYANKLLGALVLAIGCAAGAYVLAYSVMLTPGGLDEIFSRRPTYRWNREEVHAVLEPIHQLDRKLRPQRWPEIPIYLCPTDAD